MPCSWATRGRERTRCCNDAVEDDSLSVEVEDWKKVRRGYVRKMRKQTRMIVLLMALLEAMRVGPVPLVYAGKHGYPTPGEDDFGIAYNVAYFLSWLYVCAFMVVWVPVFSWWVPETKCDPENPSTMRKVADFLKEFNLILLPFVVGVSLVQHVFHTIQTLIYVDSRPVGSRKFPKNTRKNWIVRGMLLLGIVISMSCGYGAFQILEDMELARVKSIEYAVIVIPVQINIGMLFGTIMQFKMEKRIARKKMMLEAKNEEALTVDEKTALVEV